MPDFIDWNPMNIEEDKQESLLFIPFTGFKDLRGILEEIKTRIPIDVIRGIVLEVT